MGAHVLGDGLGGAVWADASEAAHLALHAYILGIQKVILGEDMQFQV